MEQSEERSRGIVERVTAPPEIARILKAGVVENALLTLTIPKDETAGTYYSLFTCKNGNLGERHSLLISYPGDKTFVHKMAAAPKITLNFAISGYLIRLDSRFKKVVKAGGVPLLRLHFPKTLFATKSREKRSRVPCYREVLAVLRRRNHRPMETKIFELGEEWLSIMLQAKGAAEGTLLDPPRLGVGDFAKLEIQYREKNASFDIPATGVVQWNTRLMNPQGQWIDIYRVNIKLMAIGYKTSYESLIENFTKEFMLQKETPTESLVKKIIWECDFQSGAMEKEAPQLYEEIRSGQVEAVLEAIPQWLDNPAVLVDMVRGLEKHGNALHWLKAFELFLSKEETSMPAQELLLEAFLERKSFVPLMDLVRLLPEDSEHFTAIANVLKTFSGNRLVETIGKSVDRPDVQYFITQILVNDGESDHLRDVLPFLKNNPEANQMVAWRLVDEAETIEDFQQLIVVIANRIKGDNSGAMALVMQQYVRMASDEQLLKALELYVSDQGKAGEVVVAELVHRRKPELMLKGVRFMNSDSMASMILAMGMIQHATSSQVKDAAKMCRSSPRAKQILEAGHARTTKGGFFSAMSSRKESPQAKQLLEEAKDTYRAARRFITGEEYEEDDPKED
ncbi:hypothetical protein ACQZV8_07110 [Magnetococcales bacterium HHB-1]